jgi:hypothetical protein
MWNQAVRVGVIAYVAPLTVTLGTRWRCMADFTPRILYTRGRNPQHPTNRRLGGSQGRSGPFGKEEKSLVPAGKGTPDCPHNSLVTIPTVFKQKHEQAKNRNYTPFRTDITQEESSSLCRLRRSLLTRILRSSINSFPLTSSATANQTGFTPPCKICVPTCEVPEVPIILQQRTSTFHKQITACQKHGFVGVHILSPPHGDRTESFRLAQYNAFFPLINYGTSHLHLVPRRRTRGAIPPLPHISLWCHNL